MKELQGMVFAGFVLVFALLLLISWQLAAITNLLEAL